jgi:lysophospholipase L1-like esterase
MHTKRILAAAICAFAVTWTCISAPTNSWKFSFGGGFTNFYSREEGHGFEPGAEIMSREKWCESDKPFYFSVVVPEGNYKVTAIFGGCESGSTNTVKSELRRLMLEKVVTPPAKFVTRTFSVNVRTSKISGSNEVHLKPRERTNEMWNWDEKLTIEFNGNHPSVSSLEIERADDLPTIYLLGDSTVCDQPGEPWNSWGQMLPRFFKSEVVVANNAQSGETLRSSLSALRLAKVLSTIKRGDYLFIQYGHNDMKDTATNALDRYKSNLKLFVSRAKDKGATPVLVTSMERKTGMDRDTLLDYPATVIAVAKEENVALLDLHAMSKVFYRALGSQIDRAFQDGTHHNNYGSYELAKCVIQGIRNSKLDLAKFISDDFKDFDPGHPDPVDSFEMPASPTRIGAKPLGD